MRVIRNIKKIENLNAIPWVTRHLGICNKMTWIKIKLHTCTMDLWYKFVLGWELVIEG